MNSIYDWLVETHNAQPHLPRVLLAGTFVSTTCGALGCFIILRRMAFLGDALAHSMLAGVTAGYLIMKLVFRSEANAPAMLIGSLVAGFITAALIAWVSRISRVKEDTAIGIMYTGIFALGGMLASLFAKYIHIDLLHFMTGNVLAVDMSDIYMVACVALFVWSVIILFFRQLQLTSFDPIMAAALGMPVLAINNLLTACTSLVVVSGVNIVGVILVVGLLVTPAATAYLLCDRLQKMLGLAALFGFTSFMLGYFLAVAINVAPGSAIVVVATLQFLVALTFAPQYGILAAWFRKRAAVSQTIVEDILGYMIRASIQQHTAAEIGRHMKQPSDVLLKALRKLVAEGLLEQQEQHFALTEQGVHAAKRLVRAHRLWETYLHSVGLPSQQLHDEAHVLEHVHDEQAVDYLDDKLGHPTHDPHGVEIPEDFVHLVPGAEVNAALLRNGRSGTIVAIEAAAAHLPCSVGQVVTAGPRESQDTIWVFTTADGEKLKLSHTQADAILVKVSD
jgi:ABC-type Mn2+/Zn2+ transport system permease subunit/Mn-dependent DtxR family transcriptional regulator